MKQNWSYRFEKFDNCIKAWALRRLPSLSSRVEVVKIFALSRVYYLASILPINQGMIKKFESVIGKFIWKACGSVLRVALQELKNKVLKGGLNLVCIKSMCKSLLLSQFLRLLKSRDSKSVSHIGFWIGDTLGDLVPGIETGIHADLIPDYFSNLEFLVVEGRVADLVTSLCWKTTTNKKLYLEHTKDFTMTKVETEAGFSYDKIWQLINIPVLTPGVRDIAFLTIHNKLPVRERLFRVGIVPDPC